MKKHITEDQWNEISEKQQELFVKVVEPKEIGYVGRGVCGECGNTLTPSIGQMIEFLDEQKWKGCLALGHYVGGWVVGDDDHYLVKSWKKEELCDALWEAVKEVLEKEDK